MWKSQFGYLGIELIGGIHAEYLLKDAMCCSRQPVELDVLSLDLSHQGARTDRSDTNT